MGKVRADRAQMAAVAAPSKSMKRYITIIAVVIIVAVLVVVGLYIWKQYGSSGASGTTSSGTAGTLPNAGTQGTSGSSTSGTTGTTGATGGNTGSSSSGSTGLVAGTFGPLSNDPVLNYFVEPNNTVLALEPNGVVAQISAGQTSYLSSSTASNVIRGSFSLDGKLALINFGAAGTAPQTSIFAVASSKWTALPQGMQSPVWSPVPGDERIAYLANAATGTETLATINAANPKAGPVGLLTLHANDLTVQWIGKTQFILSSKPSDYAPGSMFLFNSAAQALTLLDIDLPGLESVWSGPFGTSSPEGLVFSTNIGSTGGNLQFQDLSGNILENVALGTLPTKCTFGTGTSIVTASPSNGTSTASTSTVGAPGTTTTTSYLALYCGVPRDQNAFSSAYLPDDYNQMALFTSDDIYQINAENGSVNVLWDDASQNMDVSNLTVVSSSIFFVNRYDQKLYTLSISAN